mmetsp:Transcript_30079/g.96054  ORF Transcript_30079/g.96054 Transcript_30079/m.96054 type:complete len:202 (-) Transcript_30079:17-622(-)
MDAQGPGQRHEGQGPPAPAVVLPDVPEAVPRRERLQVPPDVGVAPAPDAHLRRGQRRHHEALLRGVRGGVPRGPGAAARHEALQGEHRLPRGHRGPAPHPHELDALGDAHGLRPVPRAQGPRRRRRRPRERPARAVDRPQPGEARARGALEGEGGGAARRRAGHGQGVPAPRGGAEEDRRRRRGAAGHDAAPRGVRGARNH